MDIKFEKWHGAQNDFIVLHLPVLDRDLLLGSLRRQASRLCHRHRGIGADGILVLWTRAGQEAPESLSIVNSDGSIALNCGNGLRCAMGSVLKNQGEMKTSSSGPKRPGGGGKGFAADERDALYLEVEGRSMVCRQLGKIGSTYYIAVEMPSADLNEKVEWWETGKHELTEAIDQTKKTRGLSSLEYEAHGVEVGNKHIVIISDSMDRDWILAVGPKLQKSSHWDGINVHGAKLSPFNEKDQSRAGQEIGGSLGSLFQVWVWERGAGETMACGSGAVALGVQHLASGIEDRDEWVGVDMPGGRLYVKQDSADALPILAGPAEFVYEGILTI